MKRKAIHVFKLAHTYLEEEDIYIKAIVKKILTDLKKKNEENVMKKGLVKKYVDSCFHKTRKYI